MIIVKIKHTNIKNSISDETADLTVSSARTNDINGILEVAASVGNGDKDHLQSFLMHNYQENEQEHYKNFEENIHKTDFFKEF